MESQGQRRLWTLLWRQTRLDIMCMWYAIWNIPYVTIKRPVFVVTMTVLIWGSMLGTYAALRVMGEPGNPDLVALLIMGSMGLHSIFLVAVSEANEQHWHRGRHITSEWKALRQEIRSGAYRRQRNRPDEKGSPLTSVVEGRKGTMKETISRVSLLVYLVLLVLSGFLTSAAGGRVVWFCIMGLFSLPALLAGPRKYRVLGVIALLAAMVMASIDYYVGKRDAAEIRRRMKETPGNAAPAGEQGTK